MGMFDTFYVRSENTVGIPVQEHLPLHHRGYQSQSLGCTLAQIEVDENGRLYVEHDGRGSAGINVQLVQMKVGKYCATDLTIYTDNAKGGSDEYELVVVDNQIVRVKLCGELVYLAEGYPMLDETLNPVPEGQELRMYLKVGVYPDEGKREHVFYHGPVVKGGMTYWRDSTTLQKELASKHLGAHALGSSIDLDLAYPTPAVALNIPLQDMRVHPITMPDGTPELWGFRINLGGPVCIAEPFRLGGDDLQPTPLQFPDGPTKVLAVDPGTGELNAGLLAFRDGKPVLYEHITPPSDKGESE